MPQTHSGENVLLAQISSNWNNFSCEHTFLQTTMLVNRVTINFIFSIGFRCYSPDFLKCHNIRNISWPFDYLFIDIETAFDNINNKQIHSVSFGNLRFPDNIYKRIIKNNPTEKLFFNVG